MIGFFATILVYSLLGCIVFVGLSVVGVVKFIGGSRSLMDPTAQKKTKEIVKEWNGTPVGLTLHILYNLCRGAAIVSLGGIVVSVLVAVFS